MSKLIIGCPVSNRNWILDRWFDHAEKAAAYAGIIPTYQFIVGSSDLDTLEFLSSRERVHIKVVHEPERSDVRNWNHDRFDHMVFLRNELLSAVREKKPEYFLSLDSDILLAEDAIASAISAFDDFPDAAAVGLRCYMTEHGRTHPSMGIWTNSPASSRYYRVDYNYCGPCHIIMAAKLMKPEAYNVDYEWHSLGEDLGWSKKVQELHKQVVFDGRVTNKHVMGPEFLDVIDPRCGF